MNNYNYYTYLEKLFAQYCAAVGRPFKSEDLKKESIRNEFIKWLEIQKHNLMIYGGFINDLGISIYDESTIEINKGFYDSLSGHGLSVITPYVREFGDEPGEGKSPEYVVSDAYGVSVYNGVADSEAAFPDCDWVITHNPYDKSESAALVPLAYSGAGVGLSIFGNTFDKDYSKKIEFLKDRYSELVDYGIKLEDAVFDDTYVLTIKSDVHSLYRVRTR